jgi:serine/threonine protein kinase/tetratricopeptide (TPR) repeat protein
MSSHLDNVRVYDVSDRCIALASNVLPYSPEESAMSDPTSSGDETLAMPRGEGPGGRIGPFKILQQIGEGGFGAVFEAEQEQPVKRRVALKVIKLGMDTRDVIARFEAERQALALMDHPHIARVLDAGATESGRPYFVMELVKGEPITSYCSKHKLSIADRLQLFGQVCEAVQHAHTKGIIHRDLKPNNVLVSTQDDRPFAKVIDFGIAKATSGRLTDKTLFTEMNLMMGTPLYMSPEQADGSADIDTRTDIYSLGVILYELLTDTTPIDSNSLRAAGYAEVQRIIREVEPLRPSARLSKSVTTKSGAEAKQRSESRKLTRMLRGELDWIVMKAIEKERARRYETANGLAMDVRRYLAGEPVQAAPPSASYRMQKFVRRNKGMVAAGSLIAVALLVGIAGFAWQARIAQQQARVAQQQTQLAQQRANDLEQVAKFEATMLGQVDPIQAGKLLSDDVRSKFDVALANAGVPEAERARQVAAFAAQWQQVNATDAARDLIDSTVLKPAVAAIDQQFKNQPLVDAYLRQTLAWRYYDMGLYDAAMPLQKSALATRRRVLGDDNPNTLLSMYAMSALLERQGKPAEAEPYDREALTRMRRVLGEDNPDTLLALFQMGVILYDDGRLSEAETYNREALAIQRRVLGEDRMETLTQIHNIGLLLMYEHKLDQAEPFLREAMQKMRRVLGDDHPNTLMAICNYGYLLEREGKLDQAEPYEREALAKARRALGEDHPVTLVAVMLTGMVLEKKGEHAEAEKLLAPVDTVTSKVFTGSNLFLRATYLEQLGMARTGMGEYATAEAELLEAQSIFKQTHNVTHADDIRDCARAVVALYTAWNRAEPGKGHDTKAAEWKKTLDALGAPVPSQAAHG